MQLTELATKLGFSADELADTCAELGLAYESDSDVDVDAIKGALADHAAAVRQYEARAAAPMSANSHCPYCGETILTVATKCKHCGEFLSGASRRTSATERAFPSLEIASVGAAGFALVVGSFLPWATLRAPFVGQLTKSGMEGGDGILSLILGIAAASFAVSCFARQRELHPGLLAVVGLAVLALTAFEVADLQSRFSEIHSAGAGELVSTSIGAGMWLIGFAGLWLVGLSIRLFRSSE